MAKSWQIQMAKNKLSEVIEKSITHGPQVVTKHGQNTAVIISYTDYQKFMKPARTLKELLQHSELAALDLERDKHASGRSSATNFESINSMYLLDTNALSENVKKAPQ